MKKTYRKDAVERYEKVDYRTMKKSVTLMIRFHPFSIYRDHSGWFDFKWIWEYDDSRRTRFDSFEDAVDNAWRVLAEGRKDLDYLFDLPVRKGGRNSDGTD